MDSRRHCTVCTNSNDKKIQSTIITCSVTTQFLISWSLTTVSDLHTNKLSWCEKN
jgi:hypothetical protein